MASKTRKPSIAETIDDAGIAPLPYAAISLYDHWSRDMASFWSRMATVEGPWQAWNAELDLDTRLWDDYVEAMTDLWMTPFRIAAGMAETAASNDEQAPAETDPRQG